MEQVQQELIRSNEFLAQQVWILGGLIIGLLALLGFFARAAWSDIHTMLQDHEDRIREVEKKKVEKDEMQEIAERHERDMKEHRDLMSRLSDNVNRLSKI